MSDWFFLILPRGGRGLVSQRLSFGRVPHGVLFFVFFPFCDLPLSPFSKEVLLLGALLQGFQSGSALHLALSGFLTIGLFPSSFYEVPFQRSQDLSLRVC